MLSNMGNDCKSLDYETPFHIFFCLFLSFSFIYILSPFVYIFMQILCSPLIPRDFAFLKSFLTTVIPRLWLALIRMYAGKRLNHIVITNTSDRHLALSSFPISASFSHVPCYMVHVLHRLYHEWKHQTIVHGLMCSVRLIVHSSSQAY